MLQILSPWLWPGTQILQPCFVLSGSGCWVLCTIVSLPHTSLLLPSALTEIWGQLVLGVCGRDLWRQCSIFQFTPVLWVLMNDWHGYLKNVAWVNPPSPLTWVSYCCYTILQLQTSHISKHVFHIIYSVCTSTAPPPQPPLLQKKKNTWMNGPFTSDNSMQCELITSSEKSGFPGISFSGMWCCPIQNQEVWLSLTHV